MSLNKLSVCIICKNEGSKIARCLESVKWADEIVIVDSGSTDNTIEVARQYTNKIFIHKDWQGFGRQRQRAEDYATHDWIFAIDCDEVVPEATKDELIRHLTNANENQVFFVNRLTYFCGQYIYHSGWYPDRIARIYHRKKYRYNSKLVHESVDCKESVRVNLRHDLLHYQHDNVYAYINKRNRYALASANEKLSRGKKYGLSKAIGSALIAFIRHYIIRRGFLDGRAGFVISAIQMQYTFNKYVYVCFPEKKNLQIME